MNRVRKALDCPGNAREDWRIVVDLANALGAGWEYASAEEAWDEFADLAPNWSGIRYDRIEEQGIQWPCPDRDHPGSRFLHAPHPENPSGKGKFFPVEYQPPIEQPDSEYPFVLSTGRTLYHYNSAGMTMREPGVTDKQAGAVLRDLGRGRVARSASPTGIWRDSSPGAARSRRRRA